MKPNKKEKRIIDAAIEFTEDFRPVEIGEDGRTYGPWPWIDVVDEDEHKILEELCWSVQDYLSEK